MLVFLQRNKKRSEDCLGVVRDKTLRVFEGSRCELKKTTEHETQAAARAELERFVSKRERVGFQVRHRLDRSPWLDWVDRLEQLWTDVVSDARHAKIPCDPKLSRFRRGYPSPVDAKLAKVLGPDLCELSLVAGSVDVSWVLGDQRLRVDVAFKIGIHTSWVAYGDDTLIWSHNNNGRAADSYGTIEKRKIESHVDSSIKRSTPAAFRAWFPGFVRDDVMGFTIAQSERWFRR